MYDELVAMLRKCATEAAACKTCELDSNPDCPNYLMKQAADAIEELLQKAQQFPRWIPVTERLPEEKTFVLILADTIAGKMEKVSFLYKDSESRNCWTGLDEYGKNLFDWQPTHWMPLPEPPKEG